MGSLWLNLSAEMYIPTRAATLSKDSASITGGRENVWMLLEGSGVSSDLTHVYWGGICNPTGSSLSSPLPLIYFSLDSTRRMKGKERKGTERKEGKEREYILEGQRKWRGGFVLRCAPWDERSLYDDSIASACFSTILPPAAALFSPIYLLRRNFVISPRR